MFRKEGIMNNSENGISRAVVAAIGFLIQLLWIMFLVYRINEFYPIVEVITRVLSFMVVLRVYGKHTNPDIKIPWMVLLLLFPVTGLILYILFRSRFSLHFTKKKFNSVYGMFQGILGRGDEVLDRLREEDDSAFGQSYYIANTGKYPPYENCDVEFYKEAYEGLEAQKEELRRAEKFIFMEYHAIEDSKSFNSIEDILVEKVKEGVDVRIIYDDVGSIGFVNTPFQKRLESKGIQCRVFNPVVPILNIFMNNRDHKKITVIDGKVGFTGGYNLADEYFNIVNPYGYWKDTGIKIKGPAVDSLTMIFLETWHAMKSSGDKKENLHSLINQCDEVYEKNGVVQPFADTPLDDENLSENIYLNIAKNAKKYLYIMTPYLLIDAKMNDELVMAAQRGVDVRIVTPGIPDKKTIYGMTKSYYGSLASKGVRIFQYTPGFVHAKQHVCDDKYAVVGTINMDYRSLYLHFENGVYMYDTSIIKDIREDFESVFEQCEEVTKQYSDHRSAALRIWQCILRFFAPLM